MSNNKNNENQIVEFIKSINDIDFKINNNENVKSINKREKKIILKKYISGQYFIENGINVFIAKINDIIRKKLGFKYKRINIKNSNILYYSNFIKSLAFIKIIGRYQI